MAELLARFDNQENSAQSIWRYALPERQDVSIGRRPHTDLEVPIWNRSDWVVEDPRISGRHATVHWDGRSLKVARRLEPSDRPAINPIFYKGKPNDDFIVLPGESFTIGSTNFTLQDKESENERDSGKIDGLTMTVGREELRRNSFCDSKTPLVALADLPEIIRLTRDDALLEERVLDVIMKGLPLVDFAGFVQIDRRAGNDARAALTRSKQRGLTTDSYAVSNRLVRHALREAAESVLYIWDKTSINVMTMAPGTDWAICARLDEHDKNQCRALYVAGRVPRNIVTEEELRNDREFQDYQKFVNLVGELYCSMRDMRRYETENARLRQFLPRRMVAVLEQQDLEEKLKPRVAEVTALFCDLRGSCGYTQGSGDMLASWKLMSASLDIMTSAIHEYDGVIGGLQGDAAVGFWGWPSSPPDQIDRAVRAALNIRKAFARNRELNDSCFSCGIGVAHGTAVVGRLGTFDQFKLDAFGTVMNLAARLESMTKHFGVQILVDEAITTYLEKNDPESNRARLRALPKIRPAGMTIRAPISELMPPLFDAGPEESTIPYYQWEAGVKCFIDGKWENARRWLKRFLDGLPMARADSERAARVLLEYMERFGDTPPADWDGTIEMDVK